MKRLLPAIVALLVGCGLSVSTASAQPLLEKLEKKLGEVFTPPTDIPANVPTPADPAVQFTPGKYGLFINETDDRSGVVVVSVKPGSPAAKGGVRRGDIITAVQGKQVRNVDDFATSMQIQAVNVSLHFQIQRNNRPMLLTVTLGRHPPLAGAPAGELLPGLPTRAGSFPAERPTLGVSVNPVTNEARRLYGLTVRRGALIQAIVPGSPADKYGLPLGGVIVGVDMARIDSPDDLVAVIGRATVGDAIEIAYYQREKLYHKTIRLAPAAFPPTGRRPVLTEPPLRLVPPGADRPILRQIEEVLDRFATPPISLQEPIADNRAEIQALHRQLQLLQKQLERTLLRVSELEERLNLKEKEQDEKK